MKTLRLDTEQAALLASWLRIVAAHFDREAARISEYSQMQGSVEAVRDQAVRARRLAERLDG
jgi:hypothetical protein